MGGGWTGPRAHDAGWGQALGMPCAILLYSPSTSHSNTLSGDKSLATLCLLIPTLIVAIGGADWAGPAAADGRLLLYLHAVCQSLRQPGLWVPAWQHTARAHLPPSAPA